MKRLVKLEGFGNVQMADAEVPVPRADQVLVKVKRSLFSRGSELFRRYVLEEAVSPSMMGYSDAGQVVEVGADLKSIEPGQRQWSERLTRSTSSAPRSVIALTPSSSPTT